jgi:membrane protein DedA with SNARE-associated domain
MDKAALFFYLGIFSALVGAGLGLPVPEELPIVAAGAYVGHKAEDPEEIERARTERETQEILQSFAAAPQLPFPANLPWPGMFDISNIVEHQAPPALVRVRWWIMLPICILGVVISDGLLYSMGRLWGPRLLESRWMRHLMSNERRQRIEANFDRYGVLVLLFARFLPTIRSPIFITAGVMRLPFTRFVMADGLYAIPGVSLLFFLAFWFGDQFRDLVTSAERKVETARPILILLLLCAVGVYLFYHFLRHPVATGDPREELPVIGPQVAAKIKAPEDQPQMLSQAQWLRGDGSHDDKHRLDPKARESSSVTPDSAAGTSQS